MWTVVPSLVGCMLCFVRVESHDNLGMNIQDSVLDNHLCVSLQQCLFRAPRNVPSAGRKQTHQYSANAEGTVAGRRGNRSRASWAGTVCTRCPRGPESLEGDSPVHTQCMMGERWLRPSLLWSPSHGAAVPRTRGWLLLVWVNKFADRT